jgi:hypothetical protein
MQLKAGANGSASWQARAQLLECPQRVDSHRKLGARKQTLAEPSPTGLQSQVLSPS